MKRLPLSVILVFMALFLVMFPQAEATFAQSSDSSQVTADEGKQILLSYAQRMNWPQIQTIEQCPPVRDQWANTGFEGTCATRLDDADMLTFLLASGHSTSAHAPQNSCEQYWCVCEGYTVDRLRDEYKNATWDENYHLDILSSKCADWYFKNTGGDDRNEVIQEFLDFAQRQCNTCRPKNPPTPIPPTPIPPTPIPTNKPSIPEQPEPTETPLQEPVPPRILIEGDPYADKDYVGVVADGVTYLSLLLVNDDPDRAMTATVTQPSLGILLDANNQEIEQGRITLQPAGKVELHYFPPEYFKEPDQISYVPLFIPPFGAMNISGVPVIVRTDFESDDGNYREQVETNFIIFRPPVFFVHGYFGSPDTWEFIMDQIGQHHALQGFVGTYLPGWANSSIDDMAITLQKDIDNYLLLIRQSYIKISRVDVVTHSMGGLITRRYIDNNPDTMAVRKLIMLATPNHGVNDWQRITRIVASALGKTQFTASGQLNANSDIFVHLNQNERTLGHLNPMVEYANIIGQASCGPNCPDDAVVPIASAHLNGVAEYIFDKTIHSSSLHSLDVVGYSILPFGPDDIGITDSSLVVDKVIELLTTKISRAKPDIPWQLVLEKEGRAYLIRDGVETELNNARTELPVYAHIKVGERGKAMIFIYREKQQVGRISLSSNSEIVFGVSSPDWISVWVKDGSGRFEREHRIFPNAGDQSPINLGTFNLTLGDKALIRELQTDFVVSAKDPTSVTVLDGSVIIDTFNQDGLLVQTGETITENANSSMVVDSGGNLQVQAVPSTPWWEDPFYQKPWPVDQSPLTNISQSWFLWGAIPGALCFGASFIILIAGVFTKNKKISTLGTILIAVVICSTMIAAAFYAGSQLLAPEPANPIYDAPDIPESPQENPFPDVQPTAFFPTDIPPTLAPSVPTIVPTEMPHSQEVSAQPNIYNFAACLEPCLGDLSNRRASFSEKIEKIYLRFNYDWIPPGSDYARVWKNQGEEWVRYQCQWDGPESGVFETNIREPAGFRSGEWTMEIYVDGQLIAQETVNIQGSWDYWDPAETMNKCK